MSELATPPARRTVARDGVLVEGPDARSWLEGQLSQELEGLAVGEVRLSLVLSPQGKVDSFVRVTALSDERLLLDTEAGFGRQLYERLMRFKLRVRSEVSEVAVTCTETAGGGLGAFGLPELTSQVHGEGPDEEEKEALFEAERILAGVPRLGRELTERTIPQEMGESFVAATVSFEKGCYTGQELVARLDARGSNVPRRLKLLRGTDTDELPAAGSVVVVEEKEAGEVTSVAPLDGGFVALGLVKRGYLSDEDIEAGLVEGEKSWRAVIEAQLPARR